MNTYFVTDDCSDPTTRYAKDVVSGQIVAGKFVIAQCQRHLDDLAYGHERGLYWDVDKAKHALNFFPSVLTITEGAKQGQRFELLPWHVFVIGSLFGWRGSDGFIRFKFLWLETGKGQAKSPLMAAISIYLVAYYGAVNPEIYCIGQDKNTSKVIFRDAVNMVESEIPDKEGETLKDYGFVVRGTGSLAYKIENTNSGGYIEPLANGDSKSGPKPIAVFGDEVHEMKKSDAIEIWRAAITKKHGDSFMMLGTNTPAVNQQVGTEYSEFFQKVLSGQISDDSIFAYIARIDDGDNPLEDESCWVKSLPALGITFPIDNIRKQVETAKHQASNLANLKRLYFGVPLGSEGFWTDESLWDSALGEFDYLGLKGSNLHLSLDLSQRHDLTALSGAWEGEVIHCKTWYWTCDHELDKRISQDLIPYRKLEDQGDITIIKGNYIDYSFIAQKISELYYNFQVVCLAVDSYQILELLRVFDEIGFPYWVEHEDKYKNGLKIVKHMQGTKVSFNDKFLCMPKSIDRFEDKLRNGDIVVERSELTNICSSNAIVTRDGQGNRAFEKRKSRGRIDGLVSLVMAVGSVTSGKKDEPSPYETRGALII